MEDMTETEPWICMLDKNAAVPRVLRPLLRNVWPPTRRFPAALMDDRLLIVPPMNMLEATRKESPITTVLWVLSSPPIVTSPSFVTAPRTVRVLQKSTDPPTARVERLPPTFIELAVLTSPCKIVEPITRSPWPAAMLPIVLIIAPTVRVLNTERAFKSRRTSLNTKLPVTAKLPPIDTLPPA
jgi:hypothetical protein